MTDGIYNAIEVCDNETKRVTLLSFWVEYEDLMSTEIQSFIKSSSQIKKFNL